MVMQIYTGYG